MRAHTYRSSERNPSRVPRSVALPGAVLMIVAMALAGCGFHLQGASPLPDGIGSMYVSYNDAYRAGDPPLVTTLRQRLRERGLAGASDAPAQLDITAIDNNQRIVSISPVDGRVAEYELTTRVTFDYSVNGASQLSGETLSISRDYSFDDTARLAAEARQRDLINDIHKQLAHLVLLRIADVNDKLGSKTPHAL